MQHWDWVKYTSIIGRLDLCDIDAHGAARRTVWDGDQVLVEIRYPNGQTADGRVLPSQETGHTTDQNVYPTGTQILDFVASTHPERPSGFGPAVVDQWTNGLAGYAAITGAGG